VREVKLGTTDYTVLVKITALNGSPVTGLVNTDIDIAYSRVESDNDVTTTDVTPASLSALTDAHSDWGFKEVSSTDHPGLYRLDIADAVFASGAWEAVVTITDASGTDFYAVDIGFRLLSHDPVGGIRQAIDIVESQRGHHTHSGRIFYVDGFGGNDTTGNGTRDLPYKTISKALTVCTAGNHDVVYCVGNSGATPTVVSETATVTVSKAYTFIRGPGRGVQVDLSGNGYVFDVTAVGVEISGFDIVGNGAGSSGGISVSSGADFAYLHDLWISSPTQDGIQLTATNNSIVQNCTVVAAGRDNIRIASGAGNGFYNRILDCTLRDAVGSAVNLLGADASDSQIRRCVIRDNATGITIASGTTDTVITDNRFINNTATITDGGTRTLQAWNFLASDTSGVVQADVYSISADATAANNAESFFDGTGYGPLLLRTTVASVTTQTNLTLNTTILHDALIGSRIVVRQQGSGKVIFGIVSSTTAGEEIEFERDNSAAFTIAAGDAVELCNPSYGPADRAQDAAIKAKTDSLTFTVAGKVDANATHLSGDSVAADNAESFFDQYGTRSMFHGPILRVSASGLPTNQAQVTNALFGQSDTTLDGCTCMITASDGLQQCYRVIESSTAADGTIILTFTETLPFLVDEDANVEIFPPGGTATSGGGSTVSATNVDASHTWTFANSAQVTAPKIIAEYISFNGLLAMDFTNAIPAKSAISTADSASFANITGTEPTVGTLSVSTDLKKVLIPVNATLATANTYTLSVTVTTTDSQTFVRKGQFTVS
jgi:hypothetical protein